MLYLNIFLKLCFMKKILKNEIVTDILDYPKG